MLEGLPGRRLCLEASEGDLGSARGLFEGVEGTSEEERHLDDIWRMVVVGIDWMARGEGYIRRQAWVRHSYGGGRECTRKRSASARDRCNLPFQTVNSSSTSTDTVGQDS